MTQEWTGKGSRHRTPDTDKYARGHEIIFGPKTEVYLWADYEYMRTEDGEPYSWKSDDYVRVQVPDLLLEEGGEELLAVFKLHVG